MVEHLNSKNFSQFIKDNAKVVIDFWAPWCGPCRALGPVFEGLSEKMPDVSFAKVNVDDEQNLALSFDISTIPTILLFEKGTLVDRTGGYMTEDALAEFIGN